MYVYFMEIAYILDSDDMKILICSCNLQRAPGNSFHFYVCTYGLRKEYQLLLYRLPSNIKYSVIRLARY